MRGIRLSYRWGIRIRLRPNRRASTDHAPGPIMARATPNIATTMCIEVLVEGNKRRDISEIAMKRPATGVQSPMVRSVGTNGGQKLEDDRNGQRCCLGAGD